MSNEYDFKRYTMYTYALRVHRKGEKSRLFALSHYNASDGLREPVQWHRVVYFVNFTGVIRYIVLPPSENANKNKYRSYCKLARTGECNSTRAQIIAFLH